MNSLPYNIPLVLLNCQGQPHATIAVADLTASREKKILIIVPSTDVRV
jgi:hypothetical protein